MKKTYSKPDIVFEDFSLTTSIAAGCAIQTGTPSANMCSMDFGGMNLFLSGIAACTDPIEDGIYHCYHVPIEENQLFNS